MRSSRKSWRNAAWEGPIWHLLAAALRRRAPRFISDYGDGRRISLVAEREVAVQVDGDFLGFTRELQVEVLPAAVRILAPRTVGGEDAVEPAAGPGAATA